MTRIATWNLDHAFNGSRPVQKQINKIADIDPDVIVLTETCSRVDLTGLGYVRQTTAQNRYSKQYSAIWSKHPIAERIETYDKVMTTCARIDLPTGPLIVYATIITYHGDKGRDGLSRTWEEHHKEVDRQASDWRHIQEQYPGVNFLVAGDFNETLDGSKRYLPNTNSAHLEEKLKKSSLVCVTREDFGASGKLKADPIKGYYRHNIDHICISGNAYQLVQAGAWDHFDDGVQYSDHNGVYVDLDLAAT